ncbi:efflux RND transporter periplasmic adaptor subunit [Tardiphaga sp.]|uniref:efflux RND transporter periplasmic adaptor subunit n=1 Tax=Tardiphaga sp. TaxID=1926292 RepID=UPI00352ACD08
MSRDSSPRNVVNSVASVAPAVPRCPVPFALVLAVLGVGWATSSTATAQPASPPPPAVGIVVAAPVAITETNEVNGRIQALGRVELIARVTGFLNERSFGEGADVKKGDLLFRLERPPFEADTEAKRAAVAQAQAQFDNADLALKRTNALLPTSAVSQSAADNATAAQKTAAAQLRLAKAQLQQSEINLDYTEIKAPIDGRVGRASVTVGNVVSPSTGSLATVVSQDPMYVTFPISAQRLVHIYKQIDGEQGFDGIRMRLKFPDGQIYGQTGKLDFVDINVARDTDSIVMRGTIANPALPSGRRELTNDQLVRVVLESVQTHQVLAIPRAAVLTDQQGDYVYVVGDGDIVQQRRLKLGQSTAQNASVIEGLKAGERVVVEGIQRARPNIRVTAEPVAARPTEGKPVK